MKVMLLEVRSSSPDEPITAIKVRMLAEGTLGHLQITSFPDFWVAPEHARCLGLEIEAYRAPTKDQEPRP